MVLRQETNLVKSCIEVATFSNTFVMLSMLVVFLYLKLVQHLIHVGGGSFYEHYETLVCDIQSRVTLSKNVLHVLEHPHDEGNLC